MSYPVIAVSACADANIPVPSLFGAEILSLTASPVLNYTQTASQDYNYNHPTIKAEGVDFCNITITYTHPGQNDALGVETWLPLSTWNGRIQSVGGGGWVAGRFFLSYQAMTGAIAEGYVTSSIDAGLRDNSGQTAFVPDDWAMVSEGNVDLYTLQNFGSVALHDQSILVKSLTASFYGQKHDFAYWSGCSQGGRQGMMLAQRYPDAYDGIAASAPAIYWSEFFSASIWAQVLMNTRGEFPEGCEFDYITAAAIKECDAIDGLVDGLVSDDSLCNFDPMNLVGQQFNCSGKMSVISETAAVVAASAWAGPRTPEGGFLWYGPNLDARLSGDASGGAQTSDLGYAQTACNNGTCQGAPAGFGDKWIPLFVQKNSSASCKDITPQNFAQLFKRSIREFDSIIGTTDADLSEFRAAGGKILTYHGTADGLIPLKQTIHYYEEVLKLDSKAHDFYRVFEVPGLAHCSGGVGEQPTGVWDALVAWVEHGKAPDSLPVETKAGQGEVEGRLLCPYPQRSQLSSSSGGNATSSAQWQCIKN
ncbi:feruloyl esterase B precursor [Colletotrichum tofieldiae]|nr:feruloyl esterase B precursor [Colletotrichum tofieldiae]GKT82111.1 feruloyl esterase B precursor [Colletotrichum tofieldiae]